MALNTSRSTDVLVIGSGAGGGGVAATLALSGTDVLVLEKGPRYSRADLRHDEMKLAPGSGFFVPPVDEEPHVLVEPGRPPLLTRLGWIACCVGGGTTHMGGALYRFAPDDFRVARRFGSEAEIANWPYSYEDLEPYYVRAERALGVSGSPAPPPFSGHRSASLPLPPLRSHPFSRNCWSTCVRLGLRPFATPYAINSQAYDGRPPCGYCRVCGGYGCPVGARGSAQETLLAAAERTGKCRVEPLAMVRCITVDRRGWASGCIYLDGYGHERRVRAKAVCVCCSSVETARLLLLSRSRLFPDGLANGSGQVGRHLQFHSSSGVIGRLSSSYGWQRSQDTSVIGCSLMDYYAMPAGVSCLDKGGLLRFDLRRPSPVADAQRLARRPDGSLVWGMALARLLKDYYASSRHIEVDIYHDFIPNSGTFVTLDPKVTDKWGLPVARIALWRHEHHARVGQWLANRAELILAAATGVCDVRVNAVGRVAGQMVHGTCRAGVDPSTSVVNASCQAHDVPNLFIADGSVLPTSGAAPSTLTIVANAMRTADHMLYASRSGWL